MASIADEPGASGLTLSGDGGTVYVALAAGDAISAISTSALTETARYATGTGTGPTYVAYTSGKIWFGYGASGSHGAIGSVDPATSPATVTLNGSQLNGRAYVENNPAPLTAQLTVSGNTVTGSLYCTGNSPAPVDDGSVNTVSGTASGQCAAIAQR